ncbi:alkane hydroxylase MAH1-like [Ipomoea triloba]|uniref:alkane hydroxylase MAH1-like n=1 Tax=Ipomoea triloba TaxID=35885 RepID=UPI00125E0267|nr:alkane hydroxylase MAH1-like [Ipomoea triloba]
MEFLHVLVLSVLCSVLCWAFVRKRRSSRSSVPTNWPIIGMVPAILGNAHRIHDYLTELVKLGNGTFEFKGPNRHIFGNMDMLFTCDPANINHILCKNFANYPKGPHFMKIFGGALGDGIISTDSELWELHRKTTTPLMNHPNFRALLERNVAEKIENGLFPVLDHYAEQGIQVDLQEIFYMSTFDVSCLQFFDVDPGTLSLDSPGDHPFCKAIREAVNAIFYRHILPERCWKLQKWFAGIDREKKLSEAVKTVDQFIYPILLERGKILPRTDQLNKNQQLPSNFSMVTSHIEAHRGKSMQFLRDTFLALIISGADTMGSALTWFFWLLAKNSLVESKILEEILQLNLVKEDNKVVVFKAEECHKLIYLHAAFCESLRLFPSFPINNKTPMETDILPSGHVVTPNTKILLPFHSMGRMDAIWGEDCLEFKPERWISPDGRRIKHNPSYKFPAFNAGPRSCIGREMAFIETKMVVASTICRFECQLVEPHSTPLLRESFLLEMKHGLKVKLTKRKYL